MLLWNNYTYKKGAAAVIVPAALIGLCYLVWLCMWPKITCIVTWAPCWMLCGGCLKSCFKGMRNCWRGLKRCCRSCCQGLRSCSRSCCEGLKTCCECRCVDYCCCQCHYDAGDNDIDVTSRSESERESIQEDLDFTFRPRRESAEGNVDPSAPRTDFIDHTGPQTDVPASYNYDAPPASYNAPPPAYSELFGTSNETDV